MSFTTTEINAAYVATKSLGSPIGRNDTDAGKLTIVAAQTTARYDHRTQFILNLLASNTPQAIDQVASMVAYTKCPPANDRVYSTRDMLDRVWNRDAPTAFEKQVAVRVLPRPHGRPGWTAQDHPRLDRIRVGLSVGQMLTRGVLESDVRAAVIDGWLVLRDAP